MSLRTRLRERGIFCSIFVYFTYFVGLLSNHPYYHHFHVMFTISTLCPVN
ncbi:hypothetical protein AG1IA_01756 [Rhizoctonia solani AG-1 IA]|uniref:Uncharacterized protein n=1 Tax=Thanatephorus cucumeris (strain AG1-IA) TaxID=983506 RepID=L8X6D8_THACA|nr:hypothetical protein AG1IA_01756 [Rhizoctonia solani AG-1 IA]